MCHTYCQKRTGTNFPIKKEKPKPVYLSLFEVPPPTIKEGRHVSLNAIRVEWDVTVSSGNGSDDITSFTVGLSTDNCTHFAQRKDVSDVKFKVCKSQSPAPRTTR